MEFPRNERFLMNEKYWLISMEVFACNVTNSGGISAFCWRLRRKTLLLRITVVWSTQRTRTILRRTMQSKIWYQLNRHLVKLDLDVILRHHFVIPWLFSAFALNCNAWNIIFHRLSAFSINRKHQWKYIYLSKMLKQKYTYKQIAHLFESRFPWPTPYSCQPTPWH